MPMKKRILRFWLLFVFSLAPAVCGAEDWLNYINMSHSEIIKKLGVPDRITISGRSSVSVTDDSYASEGGYSNSDICFWYNSLNVMFSLDDQGSLRQFEERTEEYGNWCDYMKAFGAEGKYRVCAIRFFKYYNSGTLPYGLHIGDSLTDVLGKLGKPAVYTENYIGYEREITDGTVFRRKIPHNVKVVTTECIVISLGESGLVDAMSVSYHHAFELRFR